MQHHRHHQQGTPAATATFPTDPSGLPDAGRPAVLELASGDTLDLRVGPVSKWLGNTTVRMLAYNGSIPGPTLKVQQGSEIIVHVTNHGDLDTTVHWHGLRLENAMTASPMRPRPPSRSAASSRTGSNSPTPVCTGTTPTSVRTTPKSWDCTATSWSFRPTLITGPQPIATWS
jgi:Multicopper oxidase